jgi:hypothetical protein
MNESILIDIVKFFPICANFLYDTPNHIIT